MVHFEFFPYENYDHRKQADFRFSNIKNLDTFAYIFVKIMILKNKNHTSCI